MTRGRKQKRETSSESGLSNRWLMVAAIAVAIAGLSFTGCSNNDVVSSNSGASQVDLGALNYFPVDVGYSVSFKVTDANGVEIRRESYTADSVVYVNGNVGVTWVQRDLSDSSVLSRGTMSWNSDRSVLYHGEDSSTNVERLLRSPLSSGAQWPRWHDPVTANDAFDLGGGGSTGGGAVGDSSNAGLGNGTPLTDGDGAEPQFSSFPTKGAQTFFVTSTTDKLTINGKEYDNCLQIVNANMDNTVNRYWYCPGVGLVKYSLNTQPDATQGTENGEIVQ